CRPRRPAVCREPRVRSGRVRIRWGRAGRDGSGRAGAARVSASTPTADTRSLARRSIPAVRDGRKAVRHRAVDATTVHPVPGDPPAPRARESRR
ncbi:MAG: hypothetical protein AVDCRST_MAG66-1897, partial [uncultured Pseudonocardia sp.]